MQTNYKLDLFFLNYKLIELIFNTIYYTLSRNK